MKIGLIGLPQVGKKTLFELLSGRPPSEKELVSGKPIKGVAEIRDPRFDALVASYKPKKEVRARIDIELLQKIEKDTIQKGEIFTDINELDAVCHLARSFNDDSVYHIEGSVDAKRDIDFVNSELMLYDLIFIDKRLERLDQKIKQTKDETSIKEKDILIKIKDHLDNGSPLRLFKFSEDENKALSSYPLVTRKAMLVVLNVSEDELKTGVLLDTLSKEYAPLGLSLMQVSAKIEAEIAKFETIEERQEFMKEIGITEPAVHHLTRLCLRTLDLISFFTVGEDEVRQWLVPRRSTAPEAAGAIHSDLEKGFIRAEVMKYSDIAALGGEDKVKEAGKFYLKGKDYIVEDGDIMNIRFSV